MKLKLCRSSRTSAIKPNIRKQVSRKRLRLKLHLFFCKTCKNYYQDNKKLSNLLKKANLKSCSDQEKEMFKQKIQNENSQIPKQQKHHQPKNRIPPPKKKQNSGTCLSLDFQIKTPPLQLQLSLKPTRMFAG